MLQGRSFEKLGKLSAAVAAMAFMASPALVQAEESAPPVNSGKLTVTAGIDWVSQYVFRGVVQQDQGLVLQPYVDLGFKLWQGDGPVNSVTLNTGIWNSMHSDDTTPLGVTANKSGPWFEADLYAGVSVGLFKDWTATVTYVSYNYPNNATSQIEELDVKVAYNDSELMGPFALAPYALWAIEIDDGNGAENQYWEFGVAPGFTLIESQDYPVKLTFPVTVGLSTDHYYLEDNGQNDLLGFVSGGIIASMPITCIPKEYGSWTLTGGVIVYYHGEGATGASSGTESFEIVGKAGISMSY